MRKFYMALKTLFIFLSFSSLCIAQNEEAQLSKYYLKAAAGYNFAFQKMTIGENFDIRYSVASDKVIEEHETVRSSLGKGFTASGTFGYVLNQNFCLEADVSYLKGQKLILTDTYHYYMGDAFVTKTIESQNIQLKTSVVLTTFKGTKQPYFRTGFVFARTMVYSEVDYSDYQSNEENTKFKYTGGISLGTATALGVNFFFKGSSFIFAEAGYTHLLFKPTKRKTVAYTYQKRDEFSTLTTSQKETEYKDDFKIKYKVNSAGELEDDQDPNEARQAGSFQLPFSSLGINVGFKYPF